MNRPGGDIDVASSSPSDAAAPEIVEPIDPADSFDEEAGRSLVEDVQALIDDGKTYLEAELAFQKTRAAFVADRAKTAFIFGGIAALLAFLALIGLTVGLIIALSPILTPWGASALVVALLALAAVLCARVAARRWSTLMAAIEGEREPGA